jgi:hypothetical protein
VTLLQLVGLLGLVVLAALARRLRDLADGRRLWANSDDPDFQGDGWRWTLCLLLPNILIWTSPKRNDRWANTPVRGPFTLDMLVLTVTQRRACLIEWWTTQQWYAAEEQRLRDREG